MKGQMQTDLGQVVIDEEVIAKYAGMNALECFGIVGMASVNMKDGLVRLLKRDNLTKGVKVEVGTEEAAVDLYLSLYYGISIPETCRAVQENVKKAIETMTGLRVVEVNVHVQAVKFEKEAPAEIAAPEEAPAPRVK